MLKLINFLVFANCQILKLPDLRDEAMWGELACRIDATRLLTFQLLNTKFDCWSYLKLRGSMLLFFNMAQDPVGEKKICANFARLLRKLLSHNFGKQDLLSMGFILNWKQWPAMFCLYALLVQCPLIKPT